MPKTALAVIGEMCMYVLADWNAARMLRALSTGGPATISELAIQLALSPAVVAGLLARVLDIGAVCPIAAGRFLVLPEVVATVVASHRDALLGVPA